MKNSGMSWLVLGLLLGTMAYAIAEDITLTTYYPSPRGAYNQLRTSSGTAASPPYAFIDDPNTGLYSGGADILRVATGGLDRVTVDAAGNVGIGDTSPLALLTVGSGDLFQVASTGHVRTIAGTVGAPSYSFTGDTNTGLYSGGADILRLSTAGSDRITVNAAGNVGLPVIVAGNRLNVEGQMRATAYNDNVAGWFVDSDVTSRMNTVDANDLTVRRGGAPKQVCANDGIGCPPSAAAAACASACSGGLSSCLPTPGPGL